MSIVRRLGLALAVLVAVLGPASAAAQRPEHVAHAAARALADSALDAMGGVGAWTALGSIRLEGMQHEFLLGNAERADGPWRTLYARYAELRDLGGARDGTTPRADQRATRVRRTATTWSMFFPPAGMTGVTIVADSVAATTNRGREAAGRTVTVDDARDRMDMAPERVLLLARTAADLRREPATSLHHEPQDVLAFGWRGGTVRVTLDRYTRLPSAVAVRRAYPNDLRRDPFGHNDLRVEYADWQEVGGGRWYPRQQITTVDGQPFRDASVYAVTFDAPAPADSFGIADSVRARFAALNVPIRRLRVGDRGAPVEIRPGIVSVKEVWATTLVRQDDGVVVFEAHDGPAFADQVMDEARRRFPGLPIKALVMTSDPWAHLGGVREFVARGVPIYVVDASRPFLDALVRRPRLTAPDLLARAPRPARVRPVRGRTVVGTGPNQFVLYPVRGAYGARMLMAYFPAHRLLYGADLVFREEGGYERTPAVELRRAVAREHLAVDSVFSVQSAERHAWAAFQPAPAPLPPPDSTAWQTAHFRDATRRVRLVVRAATGDTTERATGDRIEAERVDAAGAGTLLLTVHSSPPYLSDDSLVVSARGLVPRTERLRVRAGRAPGAGSTTVTIQYAGRRVTGTVQRGDSAPVSFDSTYAKAPFAFNEMEALLRSVPLRTGYQVVVPLFSELDRAVERDTITVLGPAPADSTAGGPARGPAWRVRFADPVIVMTARVDAGTRALADREIVQRRSGIRFRYVPVGTAP